MSEERPELLVHTDSGIGTLRFNRPKKHNAISYDMWCGIATAVDAFASDEDLRVIVLSGEGGKAFSSGADISQFEKQRATPDAVEVYGAALNTALGKLTNIPKPTIAKIQGYCLGGGLATALCCDLRIATTDSSFAIPAARLGVGYSYDALANLTGLIGPANAKEICSPPGTSMPRRLTTWAWSTAWWKSMNWIVSLQTTRKQLLPMLPSRSSPAKRSSPKY